MEREEGKGGDVFASSLSSRIWLTHGGGTRRAMRWAQSFRVRRVRGRKDERRESRDLLACLDYSSAWLI